ncbi:hypothetical protein VOLCADRAFT_105612 [Volvox carteri f. nagariensis]|uniref:Uncharacterized protein n=1 Tax=Volvox carteri f. nagariensis TaxID=3068 RepID=D8U1W5_VOLCA|nr:uncharacterized protein VOLCADRAFT_105612 [Volvox carteri f. nagariensis]EFJ46185.1 hypothetical protein VOLCADRAFT_105612 [Volvox carteri f. nagariensis]|eukprot:XP_002952632.1 hypothetical protein VOLCADRAFT_105612 [Volvox carteri f. nagariensis]
MHLFPPHARNIPNVPSSACNRNKLKGVKKAVAADACSGKQRHQEKVQSVVCNHTEQLPPTRVPMQVEPPCRPVPRRRQAPDPASTRLYSPRQEEEGVAREAQMQTATPQRQQLQPSQQQNDKT